MYNIFRLYLPWNYDIINWKLEYLDEKWSYPLRKLKREWTINEKKIGFMFKKNKLKNEIKKKQTKKTSSPLCCKFAEPNSRVDFKGEVTISYSLHSVWKIIHRDLAARNVMVGEGETCKVTNFGMARDVGREGAYQCKTKVSGNLISYKYSKWFFNLTLRHFFTHIFL